MYHGCSGLADQYYFGARTGGTNLIEGDRVSLGLFFADMHRGPLFRHPHGDRGDDASSGSN
jgi:hypothetical protein